MLDLRERILLCAIMLLVIVAVTGRMRDLDGRVAELEEWRRR